MTQPLNTRRSVLKALAAASLTLAACPRATDPVDPPTLEPPSPTPEDPRHARARAALARGVEWLLAQQDATGRFPSTTYGFLSGGESLTPFALRALLTLPAQTLAEHAAPIGRALRACATMPNAAGAIGLGGVAPDYPVYATGLAAWCLGRARPEGWKDAVQPMLAWLRTQQFTGAEWRAHPALGGFGMGWTTPPKAPHAGHVDLSMSRRALEAFRVCGTLDGDTVFRLGHRFVNRCRAEDGGYLYSPVELALNKGLVDGEVRHSYGSATTDGLLAAFATWGPEWPDLTPQPPMIVDALARLRAIHRVDENPGVRGGPMEPFAVAMRGSYRAAAADVFRIAGGPDGWRAPLIDAVLADQKDDGRWQNESRLQKEDDPIVATAFGLTALNHALA